MISRRIFDEKQDGIPTIFLHGFLGKGTDWTAISKAISGPKIFIDLPGHGNSLDPKWLKPYSFIQVINALKQSLAPFLECPINLVGYSMGGRLALALAVVLGDKCKTLTLISASPGLDDPQEKIARQMTDNVWAHRFAAGISPQLISQWYDQEVFASLRGNRMLLNYLILERQENHGIGLSFALTSYGLAKQPSYWSDLTKIRAKTQIIVGEKDPKFLAIAKKMNLKIPNCTLSVIRGAGHMPHLETKELLHIL